MSVLINNKPAIGFLSAECGATAHPTALSPILFPLAIPAPKGAEPHAPHLRVSHSLLMLLRALRGD